MFEIILRSIQDTNTRDIKAAATLATCFIESNRGAIDSLIPQFLQMTLGALRATTSRSTSIKLLEIAMAIIHYNTPLALTLIHSNPEAGKELFDRLFKRLEDMEDVSTERLIIVSFCG